MKKRKLRRNRRISAWLALVMVFVTVAGIVTADAKKVAAASYLDKYYNDGGIAFDIIDGVACIRGYTGTDTDVTIPEQVELDGVMYDVEILEFGIFAPNARLEILRIPGTISGNFATFFDETLEKKYIYKENGFIGSVDGVLTTRGHLTAYPKGYKEKVYVIPNQITQMGMWRPKFSE